MYFLRRVLYYLTSLMTLLRDVRNWGALLSLLGRASGPVTLELRDGARYRVRTLMDAWIVKETNLDRDYERFGVPLQDGWNMVDIGAGLGDFTVFAARRAPGGYVLAYEPSPESVALLRENLRLNNISNVRVFQRAIAARRGKLTLDISGGVAVQYRTAGVGGPAGRPDRVTPTKITGKVEVTGLTLADALADLPGGICDFLKLDCEGAEYEILLNAGDAVLGQVRRICLEYHDGVTRYGHGDLQSYFAVRGWRVDCHPSVVRPELGFLYFEAPVQAPA